MDRRRFLASTAIAGAAGTLAACGGGTAPAVEGGSAAPARRIQWKMVTSWPLNFPGLGTGAAKLAELIGKLSGGRLTVKVYGAGELVPAFEVFDAVAQGTAEIGHSGAYYWKGKSEAAQFFSAVPFGMNAQEMNGWLYHGGGLELWREVYAPFGLVPFPGGNSGPQMAGWFRKPITSIADLKGLKMRMPGLGGEVLQRLGGSPVNIPGADLYTAMQTGAIDATEWVGPYNDLAFGLHNVAKHCYYPGWHEPGTTLECLVNQAAFEALPEDLKAIVEAACRSVNEDMLADYTAQNYRAMEVLEREHGVQFLPLPEDVLAALREASAAVLAELAARDPLSAKVYESFSAFRKGAMRWHEVSEVAFYRARG
jgi:TRAP-type mannitol/chloroaromatic compound transport system substrate-binding protein